MAIQNSWSLKDFRAEKGKMRIGDFVNKTTGEVFKSCIFGETDFTFVAFSSKLGELTPAQIKAQVDSLQVVQLESGNYSLCKVGENQWEDVDI